MKGTFTQYFAYCACKAKVPIRKRDTHLVDGVRKSLVRATCSRCVVKAREAKARAEVKP